MKGPFISEIAYKTYAINDYGMSAMFLLVGNEKTMLIDTGVGLTDIAKTVREITDKPFFTVLTHGHGDHIGGCEQLEEMYIHPADREMYLHNDFDFLEKYIQQMAERGSAAAYDLPQSIRTGKVPRLYDLEDGMVFDLGGRRVTVLHTPDHTPGCCCFIDHQSRILFSGDACNINLGLSETINTSLASLYKIKSHEAEFDRNFNGHIGYTGMPNCYSMPDSTLDDCIWICEHILKGDAPIVKQPENTHHKNGAYVDYGAVHISFSLDNLIGENEQPVMKG